MFACAIHNDEFKCFENVLQANTHSLLVTRPVGLCQCLFPANSLTPGAAVQSDQTALRGRGTFADTAIAHHERNATRCDWSPPQRYLNREGGQANPKIGARKKVARSSL